MFNIKVILTINSFLFYFLNYNNILEISFYIIIIVNNIIDIILYLNISNIRENNYNNWNIKIFFNVISNIIKFFLEYFFI